MKNYRQIDIPQILDKSRKIPINRNERFWMDALEFLGSVSKAGGYPDFLISWTKEVLNILRDEKKVNVVLVMPEGGCWGIYIEGKDNYLFSYNDKKNIYISHRLYKDLKEKNAFNLLAGLILHETSEFIMRERAQKKGVAVDVNKNHGEAMRLERALLGRGKKGNTLLSDLFIDLAEMEMDREKVSLDKDDLYVEGCAVSGEEIISEISSIRDPNESFVLQLTPGQKKTLPYSRGYFTAQTDDFNDLFKLEQIDFKDYCNLMRIIDDLFIEESVIGGEGPFKELLMFIKKLDFEKESDNFLLQILLLFTKKYFNTKIPRTEFLYNLFLIIDEYITYFIMRDVVKEKYWKAGKYTKENLAKIIDEAYKKKTEELPIGFYNVRQDKEKMEEWLIGWFSKMAEAPVFANIETFKWTEKVPKNITKYYEKITTASVISDFQKDISTELSLHEQVLGIIEIVGSLMNEERDYNGIRKGEDSRIYELNMIRLHFWREKNIFARGDIVGLFSSNGKWQGIVEIIDIKEYSVIIFLSDPEVEVPSVGFIRKLEEEDISLSVSVEAIRRAKKERGIILRFLEPEIKECDYVKQISFFNPMIGDDSSQCAAVKECIGGGGITLIQGPPGTGKTTVIAEVILQFLKTGKKVLLSSQTNNAVDNALKDIVKWKDSDMGVGRAASKEEKIVDSNIKSIWIKSSKELEEFEREYKNGYAIGATNVGTHTLSVMKGRTFDILVMDEAGKANLVESILPMLLIKEGGKSIIVGDHKQGTPFAYKEDIIDLFIKREIELHPRLKLTREREYFLKGKLNQSLFERLIESGFKSILLNVNYRSSPQIVSLVSRLFYNNELVPAKEIPEKARSVIVIDTSKKANINERKETEIIIEGESRGHKNNYEASLIVEELRELLKYRYIATGIKTRRIAGVTILAPYIFQVEEIRRQIGQGLARRLPASALDDLLDNITTIDSFQGREDDVIMISFTRSNDNPSEVGFLSELNRINVALSRAKRKMVLIGDFQTLMNAKKGSNAGFIRGIFREIYNFR